MLGWKCDVSIPVDKDYGFEGELATTILYDTPLYKYKRRKVRIKRRKGGSTDDDDECIGEGGGVMRCLIKVTANRGMVRVWHTVACDWMCSSGHDMYLHTLFIAVRVPLGATKIQLDSCE